MSGVYTRDLYSTSSNLEQKSTLTTAVIAMLQCRQTKREPTCSRGSVIVGEGDVVSEEDTTTEGWLILLWEEVHSPPLGLRLVVDCCSTSTEKWCVGCIVVQRPRPLPRPIEAGHIATGHTHTLPKMYLFGDLTHACTLTQECRGNAVGAEELCGII